MTKKLLASFVLTIIFAMQVYAQGRTVSGKVANKQGEAIPGANIVVKGNTAIATVSNDDGTYNLANVPEKATLMFSAMGYNDAEIAVGTESVVNFSLIAVDDLSEVVVVGAVGIERNKASMNSGVAIISGADITQAKSFSAAQALTGKIAGLQINTTSSGVNAQTRILLRGSRSILGNNEALVVIDGSQSTQDAFSQINPADIESMTVLKGQAAAALYGSDASNGVLMVTTKKGSIGTRVMFSTTQQFDRISFLPKFQERFGLGTGPNSTQYNGGENQSYGPAYDGSIRGTGGPALDPMILEDGSINTLPYAYQKDSKLNAFNTGTRLQNEISISGGNETTKFYLSAEDNVQKGVVDGDKYRRTGVTFNAQTISNRLTAGFTASYNTGLQETTTGNQERGDSFYFLVLNAAGNIPLRSFRNWQNFTNPDGTLNPANPNNYYNEYYRNPWFDLDNNRENTRTNNLRANVSLVYKITDWLTFTYRPGITNTNATAKTINGKYQYRDYSKTVLNRSVAKDLAGSITDNSGYQTKLTQDALLTFNPKFTSALETTLILGSNINDNSAQNVRIATTSIVVPNLNNVGNRLGEPIVNGNFNRISQSRTTSVFADLSLGYKKMIYLQVTGRNEWSSLLDKGNNSYFFPGANVSFVVSNMIPALKESNVLTFAKVTASAAQVGQVSLGAYGTRSIFSAGGGFPYGSQPGFTVGNNIVQKGIKPEFTTAYEVGAELAFYDRVNLEGTVYQTETTNQTLSLSLPQSSGYTQQTRNIGATQTRGLELTLRGDVIKAAKNNPGGLNWNVGANYSYRDNKVLSLFDETKEIRLDNANNGSFNDSNGGVFAIVGEQYPVLKVTNYLRDPQGRVVVNPTTGYPVTGSGLTIAGQTSPKHSLGINTTLSYKGFSFFALAEYRAGNVYYHDLGWDLIFTGNAAVSATYDRQRFVFPNSSLVASTASDGSPATFVANTSLTTKDGGVDFWDNSYKKFGENFVTSGAFWKLREARLTYKLPASALETMSKYIKGVSISFVGRNLLIFVPKTNQFTDPEFGDSQNRGQFGQATGNTPNAAGVSTSNQVPTTRTYGFNITVTL